MTYAAEPYAQFVDDLLTALTGGAIRDEFRFLPEQEPFELTVSAAVLPKSVRVFGLADGEYTRFRLGTDFKVAQDGPKAAIAWQPAAPGKDVVHPDAGSTFFVNYEYLGANPALTDRNTGSVTRLLAESFAREYATLSKQLEGVYEAAFIDTASGRDLDQLAALLGIVRRRQLSASGSVVFSRSTPSPADIFIPAGTKLSTADAPAAVFETTDDRTLQRGALSVDAPVSAVVPGDSGLVAENAIRVMNRPILGIETVGNPVSTRFSGADETDELLRARCRRALETSGKATTGSLLGALTTLPGLREKDIRIAEDYLAHPGVVYLDVVFPEMSATELTAVRDRAVALIEATRPVGIRIEHNIDSARPPGPATPSEGTVADDTTTGDPVTVAAVPASLQSVPVNVDVQLTPATLAFSAEQRARLTKQAEDAVAAFIADAGVGEALVYNRLVATLMQLEGVLDVALRMGTAETGLQRKNVISENAAVKPVKGAVTVTIGGALVMLDVTLDISIDNALLGPPDSAETKRIALAESAAKLQTAVANLTTRLSVADLLGALPATETYSILGLHYHIDFVDAGVRIRQQDVELPLTGLERLWVRKVSLAEASSR